MEQPWDPAVLVQLPSDQLRLSGVAADDEALYRSTCKRNGFAGPGEVHMMPKGGGAARLQASLSAAPAKGRRCRDGAA